MHSVISAQRERMRKRIQERERERERLAFDRANVHFTNAHRNYSLRDPAISTPCNACIILEDTERVSRVLTFVPRDQTVQAWEATSSQSG